MRKVGCHIISTDYIGEKSITKMEDKKMRIRKVMEGQIYCQDCVSHISGRVPTEFAVQFPASHDKIAKAICSGCHNPVNLCEASKVVKK